MKKIILGLALLSSVPAFAGDKAVVFPQVYNYGFNIQVQVWNNTDRAVNCSGFIYYNTQGGFRDSEYYFDYVSARFNSFRTIYPRTSGDRILSVSHSIFCN